MARILFHLSTTVVSTTRTTNNNTHRKMRSWPSSSSSSSSLSLSSSIWSIAFSLLLSILLIIIAVLPPSSGLSMPASKGQPPSSPSTSSEQDATSVPLDFLNQQDTPPDAAMLSSMTAFVRSELGKRANATRAAQMQKYAKTDMPMYGIQKPERAEVEKAMYQHIGDAVKDDHNQYTACVQALWNLPHREEKYLAIDLAMRYKQHICPASMPLYESMLREEYMWWDLCDPMAIHLVGGVALRFPSETEGTLRSWIDDPDSLWIRRTAILSQLMHKKKTNDSMLFEFCRTRMHEKEFFIRKAIGWALRQHSRIQPDLVAAFLTTEKASLSGLSYREGAKHLIKQGKLSA